MAYLVFCNTIRKAIIYWLFSILMNANIGLLFFQQGKTGLIIQTSIKLTWFIEIDLLERKFKDMDSAIIIIEKKLKIDKTISAQKSELLSLKGCFRWQTSQRTYQSHLHSRANTLCHITKMRAIKIHQF